MGDDRNILAYKCQHPGPPQGCPIHLPEHLTLVSGKGNSWGKPCEICFLTHVGKATQNCKSVGCLFILANSPTGGGNKDSFSAFGVWVEMTTCQWCGFIFHHVIKGLWFLILKSLAKTGRPIAPSCRFLCLAVKIIRFELTQRDQLFHLDHLWQWYSNVLLLDLPPWSS